MLRLALEPFEDETWGGAFGSTAEDCERLRSLLLVEVAKGLSEGPADGAAVDDDDASLCAYCGGEGRGVPVNWVVDVADHALTWFLGTAFEYVQHFHTDPAGLELLTRFNARPGESIHVEIIAAAKAAMMPKTE